MLGNVEQALKRKFGPLPAWAWAVIGFGAVYYYRRLKGDAGGGGGVPDAQAPGIDDATQRPEPILFNPGEGEAVYDPASGQVYGGGSGGGDGGGGSGGGDGGGGGGGSGGVDEPPGMPGAKPGGPLKRIRKLKPKPRHAKAAKGHKGHGAKTRARLKSVVRGKRRGKTAHPARHPVKAAKPRRKAQVGATPARGRAHAAVRRSVRQRPAAPKVVNHGSQRVVHHTAHERAQHRQHRRRRH